MRLDNDWIEVRDDDEYLHISTIAQRFNRSVNHVREQVQKWERATGKRIDHRGDRWNLRHTRNVILFSRANINHGAVGRRTH